MPEMDLRQIDALVAENVMQWPWRVWDRGKHSGKKFLADPLMEGWMAAQGAEPLHDDAYALVPSFSSDIAASWQVVERMKQLRFNVFALHHYEGGQSHEPQWVWRAVFSYPNSNNATADTAPLAICLAALKAIGVEVPDHA